MNPYLDLENSLWVGGGKGIGVDIFRGIGTTIKGYAK